jgi:hypothetical protein
LASSLAKGVAGIPDMFVNAAPSLVGLGMAGVVLYLMNWLRD